MPGYWVQVFGPNVIGGPYTRPRPFASDSLSIARPTAVDIDPVTGALVITALVQDKERVVVYPKGEFTKVIIGGGP